MGVDLKASILLLQFNYYRLKVFDQKAQQVKSIIRSKVGEILVDTIDREEIKARFLI